MTTLSRFLRRLASPAVAIVSLWALLHEPPLSQSLADVIALLDDALSLNGRAAGFLSSTPLLGALPEFDSMAVASILAGIEDRFGITIEDDEVDGATFESVGSLAAFIDSKLG